MRRTFRDLVYRWKEAELFREPGKPSRNEFFTTGRRGYMLVLLLGVLLFFYALFAAPSLAKPLTLGLAAGLLLKAVAELLPKDHMTLAGIFRLGSILTLALGMIAMFWEMSIFH